MSRDNIRPEVFYAICQSIDESGIAKIGPEIKSLVHKGLIKDPETGQVVINGKFKPVLETALFKDYKQKAGEQRSALMQDVISVAKQTSQAEQTRLEDLKPRDSGAINDLAVAADFQAALDRNVTNLELVKSMTDMAIWDSQNPIMQPHFPYERARKLDGLVGEFESAEIVDGKTGQRVDTAYKF